MIIKDRAQQWLSKELQQRFLKMEPATIGHKMHFGFMDPRIQSLLNDVNVVGQAFTVKTTANDALMVHKAVSMIEEGDILVIDRTSDTKHAPVGELVVHAAKARKASAIIVDGPATDIQAIREIGLPVFATGLSPITTKLIGNSGEINTSIQCGGVVIHPGDLITADENGILVLPKEDEKSFEEILDAAEKSDQRELEIKKRIDEGAPLASLTRADELLRQKGIIK